MRTIKINLHVHVTPLSSHYTIQTKGSDIHSPPPLLKNIQIRGMGRKEKKDIESKEAPVFIPLPSPLLPPLPTTFLPLQTSKHT